MQLSPSPIPAEQAFVDHALLGWFETGSELVDHNPVKFSASECQFRQCGAEVTESGKLLDLVKKLFENDFRRG